MQLRFSFVATAGQGQGTIQNFHKNRLPDLSIESPRGVKANKHGTNKRGRGGGFGTACCNCVTHNLADESSLHADCDWSRQVVQTMRALLLCSSLEVGPLTTTDTCADARISPSSLKKPPMDDALRIVFWSHPLRQGNSICLARMGTSAGDGVLTRSRKINNVVGAGLVAEWPSKCSYVI